MSARPTTLARLILLGLLIAGLFRSTAVSAQQVNGVPGSADATVTLDGKQLPPPPMPFGGVIKTTSPTTTRKTTTSHRKCRTS
jgi:hypothetical protein